MHSVRIKGAVSTSGVVFVYSSYSWYYTSVSVACMHNQSESSKRKELCSHLAWGTFAHTSGYLGLSMHRLEGRAWREGGYTINYALVYLIPPLFECKKHYNSEITTLSVVSGGKPEGKG